MAISHKNIPDSDLHNPKGFSSAANSTVAKKNSSGNLEWGQVDTADVANDTITNDKVLDGTLGAEKFQSGTEERDWVLERLSSASALGVGTYVIAVRKSTDTTQRSPGYTTSGSNLKPAQIQETWRSNNTDSGTLSGTWQLMSVEKVEVISTNPTTAEHTAALWFRIS